MIIKTTAIILWVCFVGSLFSGRGVARENSEELEPLEHIDRPPIVFAMPDLGCAMCNRSMELFYKEAFSRLGYTFAYTLYPLKRSLAQSNAGRIDGECARGKMPPALQKKYPNRIQVKESIWESCICAYAMNPDIRVNGWEDLKKYKDMVIGFSKGGVYLDKMVQKYSDDSQKLYGALNYTQGLRMLSLNRIGIFLGFAGSIDSILKEEAFSHKHIYNVGTLATLPLYPYLNKKHAHLAKPLALELKKMKKEHIIEDLVLQAQKEVFGPSRKVIISIGFLPPKKLSTNRLPGFLKKATKIVTRAFALENYQVSYIYRSKLSAFNMAKDGLVDGTMFWRKTKSRKDYFYFTDPVLNADIVFFHLKSKKFDWQQLDDLGRYRAGLVEGMHHEDLFDAAAFSGILPCLRVNDETTNYKNLLSGKVDYVPAVLETGYDTIESIFPGEKKAALFTHHPKPLARQSLYLLLSKQKKGNQAITADFNHGLYHLQKMELADEKQAQPSAP